MYEYHDHFQGGLLKAMCKGGRTSGPIQRAIHNPTRSDLGSCLYRSSLSCRRRGLLAPRTYSRTLHIAPHDLVRARDVHTRSFPGVRLVSDAFGPRGTRRAPIAELRCRANARKSTQTRRRASRSDDDHDDDWFTRLRTCPRTMSLCPRPILNRSKCKNVS